MAPPWIRGSLANATAVMPSIAPTPASTPLASAGVSSTSDPESNSASSLTSGSRGPPLVRGTQAAARSAAGAGACGATGIRLSTTVTSVSLGAAGKLGSGGGEGKRDIGAAEAE